jgi:hypothetical protein
MKCGSLVKIALVVGGAAWIAYQLIFSIAIFTIAQKSAVNKLNENIIYLCLIIKLMKIVHIYFCN